MRVFVWKSHGDITVYAFDTEEQKSALKKQLVECLVLEGSDVNESSTWSDIFEAIEDQRYSDSDQFESCTGIEKVVELV